MLLQVLRVRDPPAHLYSPDEVEDRLDEAVRRNAKELLVLTGELPEVNPEVARAAAPTTGTRTSSPTSPGPASGRSSAGCCRTRTSASSSREDLARLREVTASQGLMLESIERRLVVHQGSPTKHPAVRLETIDAAGELRIPFTSGILVGIGETRGRADRVARGARRVARRHGHIQEVILQNFVPHPRYYGREVAEIADDGGAASAGRTGDATSGRASQPLPDWATRSRSTT